MLRGFYILLAGVILTGCDYGQTVAELGKPVPDYTFSNILNTTDESMTLQEREGKVLILEFWATWCGPCIPVMKKLDSLQTEFQDEVEVIAISFEEESRLQKFIETTGTKLRLVSDSTHQTHFKYKEIPHTIIVDGKGVVRAITNPKNISREVLINLITKDEIDLAEKDDFYINPDLKVETIASEENTGYRINLNGYDQTKRGGSRLLKNVEGEINGIEMYNSTIPRMYQSLLEVPSPNRMVFRDSLSYADFPYEEKHQYNLTIEVSSELENMWRQMGIDFLNNHFEVNARMSIDTLVSYVLTDTKKVIQESSEKKSKFMFMGPVFKTKKIKIARLTGYLENFTDIPVVDQTGLHGEYDIELNWQIEDPSTLFSELEKYGLKMEKSEKKVPVEVMEIFLKKTERSQM